MPPEERIRAFIAIDIEDPSLIARLVQIRDSFVATGAPMKPVEDYNMHITLRFLGEISAGLIDVIYRDVLSKIRFNKFKIRLYGVGAFPSIARPRVIWVGVKEGREILEKLYREIESGLRKLGFRPEREEFVPHVTLARLKGPHNLSKVVKLLQEFSDVDIGEMEVTEIRLKQSILTPRGPIYRTLKSVKAIDAG